MLESLALFIKTAYGQLTVIAAAVGVLWGLLKAIGALRRWVKATKWYRARQQRRDAPQKILQVTQDMTSRIELIERQVTTLGQDVTSMKCRLQVNNECTATVMLEKMMFAYHHYYLQGNPIPLQVRTALEEMFDQYKSSNPSHNHVPDDFKERIAQCSIVGQSTAM